ncbi:MAG TPA: 30S ribosome-binding factor RbfA [Coriobacteriia bacterium]|nr:30S ribosome-binding factor RbfA [Coriobacteriia bacterium]
MRESFGRKSDEQLREAVASIIASEISDPRVALITVTGAKVSSDRSVAELFVSADPGRYDEVLAGLESAKGRIRSLVGHGLGWRVSPELRFHIDESVDAGERIAEALTHIPPTLVDGVGAEPSVPEDDEA